jgi:hypothetical protein
VYIRQGSRIYELQPRYILAVSLSETPLSSSNRRSLWRLGRNTDAAAKRQNVDLFPRFAVMRYWSEIRHVSFQQSVSPAALGIPPDRATGAHQGQRGRSPVRCQGAQELAKETGLVAGGEVEHPLRQAPLAPAIARVGLLLRNRSTHHGIPTPVPLTAWR